MIEETKRVLREIDKKKWWGKKSLEVAGMKNVKPPKRKRLCGSLKKKLKRQAQQARIAAERI